MRFEINTRVLLFLVFVGGAMLAASLSAQLPSVLYYKMNENAGTSTANAANPGQGSNPVNLSANASWNATGRFGSAISFTSVSGGGMSTGWIPNLPNTQSWTLEFYVNAPATSTQYMFGNGVSSQFRIFTTTTGGLTLTGSGFTTLTVSSGILDNTWHHVAYVFDGTAKTMTVYRDGTQVGQNTGQTTAALTSTAAFCVGGQGITTTSAQCSLDEVRFWTTARTQAEIQANMNNELNANAPTLTPTGGSGFSAARVYTGSPGVALASADLSAGSPVASNIDITITPVSAAPGVTAPANQTGVAVPFTLSWTGTPTTAGSYSYTVALTDGTNSANYTVFINVVSPDVAFSYNTTSISDGGTHALGSGSIAGTAFNVTYTVQNTGTASLTLSNPASITNLVNCGVTITTAPGTPIAVAASTTTVLQITPAAVGAFSFDYSLGNNVPGAKNPYNFTVTGTAALYGPLTVTLGNQASGNAFPFNYSAGNGRFQSAYSSTEMAAVAGRYITQVRVWGSAVTPVPQYGNLRLRLAHTALATNALTGSFDTNYTGSLVTVLGPTNYTPTATAAGAGAWYTFTFASPFLYNGTSNLLVDWSYDSRSATGFTVSSGTGRSRVYLNGGSAISPTGTTATSGEFGIEFTYQGGTVDGTGISQNTVADGAFAIPATNKVMMDLNLMTIGSNRDLTSITFTKTGTITDAEVSGISLVRDNNSDGIVDGGDTVLGTGTLTSGAISFSGTPLQTVTTAASVRLLLAVSIPSGPASNANIQFSISAASSVTWSGGTDFNSYPIIATSFVFAIADMSVLRGATAIADGGTDTGLLAITGVASPVTYTIQNPGAATLTLTNPASISSMVNCNVTITTAPAASVAPAGSTTTVLSITPTAAGAFSFNWSIGTNVPGAKSTYDFNVNGTAQNPLSGNYVINQAGGSGVDFTSIGAAFDALESLGVGGPVTLTITDSATYTANSSYTLGINGSGTVVAVPGVSATNTITLRAATGQSPKIQGNATGAILQSPLTGRGALGIMTSFVTVEGLEVFGGPNFGIIIQGNNTTLNPVNNTIRRCKVRDIPDGPGIAFMGQNSAYATNILIENNFVWNCFTNSGNPTASTVLLNNTGGAITIRNAAQNSGIVRHNTILHTSSFGGTALNSTATAGIYAYSSSTTYALNEISNNIVVCTNATVAAIYLYSATSNPTPANCNFNCWNSTVFLARAGAAVTFATWQAETRDANGTTASPQLVSTSSPFDLHLQSSSPCVNPTGQTSTVAIDIDGESRPQGATTDIGADEWSAGSVAPTITSSAPANGVVGTAYSHTFTATGSPSTFTWSVSAGSMPPGLTLGASSGVLSGTPTSSGNYGFTVMCDNGVAPNATQVVNMVVNQAPAVTSAAPANALLGAAYSHTFTASGFPATFTWSVTAGALPAGLTLNASSGVLSGTPTSNGSYGFTIGVSNGISPNASQVVNMNVNEPPTITSAAPGGGNVGVSYSHTYTATGFPSAFTWTVTSGALPNGLTLNASSGLLSGTPTAAGTFNGVVTCSNGVSPNATQGFSISITAAPQAPAITSGAPANGLVGATYSHTFTASGNPTTFTWSVSAGSLPAGLSLNASSGVLSGTPTASGAFSFTVTCSNGVNPDANQPVSMNVNQPPTITSAAPGNGLVGSAYSHTFTATGFPASFTWSVSAGALPGGLSLNASSGVLSGSPSASGAFNFTVSCANGISPNATQVVNMNVNQAPATTSSAPANGLVGAAYSHTFTASGFPTTFTWTVSSGSLPSGLSLNASSGVLSGTPSASGAFAFTVQCANGISPAASQVVNMNVNAAPSITSGAPANAPVNVAYTHTFTGTGFPATLTWSVSAGALPAGLTLGASSGVLSGTPTTTGTYNFTISCSNGISPDASQVVSMDVTLAPTITSAAPASGVVGSAYTHTFTATGFPSAFNWTVTVGTLPAGLTLNATTGVLSGTPTAAGASAFTVTCSNGVAPDATQPVNMQINQAPTITSVAPPNGATFTAYSHTCTATGTPATFTWSVSAGALPGGLTLNATTGAISGTPAAVGVFTGTISCSNGIAPDAAQAFNITVTATPAPNMNVLRGTTNVADGGSDALGNATITLPQSITYTITNNGSAALNLTGTPNVVVTGGAMNVTGLNVVAPATTSVAISASVTFTVQFVVPVTGAFSFTVSIDNNDPNTGKNPYNWTVNGTGVTAPEIDVMRGTTSVADGGSVTLSNLTAGFSSTFTFTINNTGNAPLSITTPITVGTFANCTATVTTQPNSTVAAGGSTSFTVSVLGGTAGAYSFNVSITNNDADENPYNFTANGTVVPPGGSMVGGGGSGGGGGGGCTTSSGESMWLMLASALLTLTLVVRLRRRAA